MVVSTAVDSRIGDLRHTRNLPVANPLSKEPYPTKLLPTAGYPLHRMHPPPLLPLSRFETWQAEGSTVLHSGSGDSKITLIRRR